MFWGRKVLGFFSAYFAYYLTLDPCGLLLKKRLTNILLTSNFFFSFEEKSVFFWQTKAKSCLVLWNFTVYFKKLDQKKATSKQKV